MRTSRLALLLVVTSATGVFAAGCKDKFPPPGFDPEKRSGPDAKRSGAQLLKTNKPKTDEVSYRQQDRTDWYVVTLRGQPNVMATEIHWDNAKSDLMVDVFDEFGKQISASPTRSPGMTQKSLLTQIDKPGVYYVRVSAAKPEDGSVYTMEAKWDSQEVVEVPPTPPTPPPVKPDPPTRVKHVRPDKPEPDRPALETIQGHIVNAYKSEGGSMTIHIDKGSSAGVKVGQSGTILSGPSGEDPLSGGGFKVIQVLDGSRSVGRCQLSSVGKNTRVAITVR
jgi:hypothetical protein